MRHGKKGKKFHRTKSPRKAFIKNLAMNVIQSEKVETTEVRAKAIRPVVERLVRIAQEKTVASRRTLLSRLGNNKEIAKKLEEHIAPRYTKRPGGYMRIVKLAKHRKRDGTRLARIEFVE